MKCKPALWDCVKSDYHGVIWCQKLVLRSTLIDLSDGFGCMARQIKIADVMTKIFSTIKIDIHAYSDFGMRKQKKRTNRHEAKENPQPLK